MAAPKNYKEDYKKEEKPFEEKETSSYKEDKSASTETKSTESGLRQNPYAKPDALPGIDDDALNYSIYSDSS